MKPNITNVELRASVFGILFAIVVFAVLLSLTSCSSGVTENNSSDQKSFTGNKSFSFNEEESTWRVDFDGDEISALYKDGSRLPDSEINQHKDMIYEKLDGLRQEYQKPSDIVHHFHFDGDKFGEDMKKFKDYFDKDSLMHFKIEFDKDKFEKNIEKLNEHLKDLKDKKIEPFFNSEEFNENMKELEDNLKNLPSPPSPPDVDVDVYLDMNDFKDGMKQFGEAFKHFDFKIDSSDKDMRELRKSMKELKKNMKGLKIEFNSPSGETKKMNSFLKDLKRELVNDGYIKSTDEDFGLEMDMDNTKINDVKIKSENHVKYKEMYKKHFDKELDGTFKIKKN